MVREAASRANSTRERGNNGGRRGGAAAVVRQSRAHERQEEEARWGSGGREEDSVAGRSSWAVVGKCAMVAGDSCGETPGIAHSEQLS